MKNLSALYQSHFGVLPEILVPLTGSASNRSYFKMLSGRKKSVGVVGLDRQENQAFLTIASHLRSKGVNVPEIYTVSDDQMRYIQEDLGSDVLFDVYKAALKKGEGVKKVESLLCRTMSLLPHMQFAGADGLDFSVCYPQPSFDRTMVMFDLNYFKYCFLKPSGLEFNEMKLQKDFERLADELLSEDENEMVFMHRDFQARNVMIKDGEPYFIDFQGGRKGPFMYDVASFVWHARSSYPQELKERMLNSYISALGEYMNVDRSKFDSRLRLFVLFRTLQVLGAYGFRGLMEHKSEFVICIPQTLASLRDLLEGRSCGDAGDMRAAYPYLVELLGAMVELPRFRRQTSDDGRLTLTVSSFSFKKGIPEDLSGNGGGYVFDCRSIHNPGRYEQYKRLTGRDEDVISFLEDDGEITAFLGHVYGVVEPHVKTYLSRGFTSLMVSFGCTGGQHRSVYCAEHLARYIASSYPSVRVVLIHREQGIKEEL